MFFGGTIIFTLLILIISIGSEGLCISDEPVQLTSRLSRRYMDKLCEGEAPCHVYLTLPENTTNIFVNFQFENPIPEGQTPTVYYDVVSRSSVPLSSYSFVKYGRGFVHETLDFKRGIYWVLLDDLTPETTYYFRAGYGDDSLHYSVEKSFSALPSTGPLHFVTGGDMSTTPEAVNMSRQAAKLDPMFAVIGGDVEYSNGFATCYRRIDEWINQWEENMNTLSGHLIPFVLSIGNHEAGGFGVGSNDIPFFMSWFPQSVDHDDENMEQVVNRLTYHQHNFSDNTILYVLDSGIHVSAAEQAAWMDLEMGSTSRSNKLAVYHVPLYPSYRPFETPISAELRANWGPVFDRHSLATAFENHDHAYKRTKLIKNNEEHPSGTLYIGDGCWGAACRPKLEGNNDRWYLERYDSYHFVFIVDVWGSFMNFTTIDINGTITDEFSKIF